MVGSKLFPDLGITGKQEIMGMGLLLHAALLEMTQLHDCRNPNMFYNSLKMVNSSNSHEVHPAISVEAPL